MERLSRQLKSLPASPGVYLFKSEDGELLYVGKAASLKDRVGSYFSLPSGSSSHLPSGRGGGRMIELFISEVKDLEIRKTDTVLEAYILEQNLIKEMQPKYNMMSKDDKSFVYVVLTKEDFPRFIIARGTDVAQISNDKFQMTNQIPNPNGQNKKKKKKKIQNTKYKIQNTIYGPYTSKKQIEIVLKILRKIFPYHAKSQHTEKGCFDHHIGLCPGPYDGKISKEDYRKNIQAIRMILEGKKTSLLKRMKRDMHDCADKKEFECAAQLRNRIFALQHIQDIALISKRDENFQFPISNFQINSNDKISNTKNIRIEGYDISNISGKFATGSMVVFDNAEGELKANKNQYRKFHIKTIEGANDVGAMEEMLLRRFRNNWPLPNLMILDGGRGHLNMARRVLRTYHLEIPLLAVAKGPTRKKLDLYSWGSVPEIPADIIEQVRDEAHRFAIAYHRKIRNILK